MLKRQDRFEMEQYRKGSTERKKYGRTGLCLVFAGGLLAGAAASAYASGGTGRTVSLNLGERVQALSSAEESAQEIPTVSLDSSDKKGSLDVTEIVKAAMPSVVSITTKTLKEVQDYYGMYPFGGPTIQQEVEGSGSGIIIGQSDSELLIVTNNHVIENANAMTVTFADGNSCEAKAKGTDSDCDLAVVAVDMEDISGDTKDEIAIAVIGDSDELEVGEQVVAIGNALGYGQSVTTGIVSAKNRSLGSSQEDGDSAEDAVKLVQTDAAINPGNSGGPLLNMDGQVVGINSVKMASSGVEGMGYAIAITDVTEKLTDLMNETTREKVEDGNQGALGITAATVDDSAIQLYDMPEGVFVSEVTEGSAADKAGIQERDIITKLDGKKVTTIQGLKNRLEYYRAGEEVEVTIERAKNGEYKEKTVTATLDQAKEAGSQEEG